jgi:Zn-dependent M28 family amino/carboxypeptidase
VPAKLDSLNQSSIRGKNFMKYILSALILWMTCILAAGCSPIRNSREKTLENSLPASVQEALRSFSTEALMNHIRVLSSDEYEGRAPGTHGEERTVQYLIGQFHQLGLKPGNPDGTFVQKVPLAGFTPEPKAFFTAGSKKLDLKPKVDYVAVCRRYTPGVRVDDSDVVFVGYGVVAPEYGWDDYKDLDVKGKTLVMLINDPPVPDSSDPIKLDDRFFKGKSMTYYGRWTYKYEIATEKGAAAAIIVHETGPAGYPFEVVSGSWGRENFNLRQPDKNMGRVAVESWISLDAAKKLFQMGGQDFDALKKSAVSSAFKPVPLKLRANFAVTNRLREVDSQNVVAKLEGSDPKFKDELIVYSAHWDHLGKDERLPGDQIFNGASDNASGVGSLLELAKAFAQLNPPPKRSVLFLSVTAEEKGLLGAKQYAENPLYPLAKTVAIINMDGMNQWGKTRDIVVVGLGKSTLEDDLKEAAQLQGRVVAPDPEPEKGFYYRSDHFELALKGVPALYVDSGNDYAAKPAEYGQNKRDEYTYQDYHKVSDEIKPDWDLSGAVDDTQLLFLVGFRVAQAEKIPQWKPGAEFKARRDEVVR